ncbi:MAG: hypothetical protein AAFQ67_01220, partial [Pseudomonadota bacterium]
AASDRWIVTKTPFQRADPAGMVSRIRGTLQEVIMSRYFVLAAGLGLAACAAPTTTTSSDAVATPAVESARATPISGAGQFALAMGTVETLVAAGNKQTAIDRLTQLLGDADLTAEERAEALLMRGELRVSNGGYDIYGGLKDFDDVVQSFGDTPSASKASDLLEIHRGRATSLNYRLEQPDTTRSERFSILFALGEHDRAMDLMQSAGVTPSNDELVAMYQIGYLCEGSEYTGPSYSATDTDGTFRTLRFCDFGK